MKGSYTYTLMRQLERMRSEKEANDKAVAQQAALAEEAAELKRARIMNRVEPGYERKDGKL